MRMMRRTRPLWPVLLLVILLAPVLCGARADEAATGDEAALIRLARAAVRAEVEGGAIRLLRRGRSAPACPVFVTIERGGRVLGCRGALVCRRRSLEEEVVTAARAAASHDPRYPPLTGRDLAHFQVTVTIVRQLRPLDRMESLTPDAGLVLRAGGRVGVVLP